MRLPTCDFRIGIAEDIRKLEWGGEFSEHREIIERAFSAQTAGSGLVLVGVVNEFPVAQLWVRFAGRDHPARLWAFRVMRPCQGLRIGGALLTFAENELAKRRFESCEIGADKSNVRARMFYERRGYRFVYGQVEDYSYVTPSGVARTGRADQWILHKELSATMSGRDLVQFPSGRESARRA